MGKAKRHRFYAVRVGRVPGVYDTWEETERQVREGHTRQTVEGNILMSQVSSFPRAIHKSFPTRAEAEVSGTNT